jgi:hypothetical protein
MSLTDALQEARRNNEGRIEKSLRLERPELTGSQRLLIGRLQMFCRQNGVSQALPLSPVLVAAFLEREAAPDIEGAIAAIQAWHSYYFLADPCSSLPVRVILERRLRIQPPRSFNKQDRELFATLPVEIRSVVYRREQERDNALRRLQQRAAEGVGVRIELRKFLARSKNRITQKD